MPVSYFFSSYDMTWLILILVLNAMDFWTVKNVTGRLLVGLRWFNRRMPDGSEEWDCECLVDESKNNVVDTTFFWGG